MILVRKLYFIFLLGILWLFIGTQSVQAGCCECKPPGFLGNIYVRDCQSQAFSVTDCQTKCLNSNQGGFEEGYPKYSHICDENQCPVLNEASCCVDIQKIGGNINGCEDITAIQECQSDDDSYGYFQSEPCSQVPACSHIGEFYAIQGINDNLGNVPESEETEKYTPIYFKPQVTIPGTIKIGGGVFSVNKGQGISVDGGLLSRYIALLMNWLIGAVGVIAVAYLAFGGMQWLAAAGSSDGIKKAKETIKDALIGILLAVGSYALLFVINPNLVNFQPLKINEVNGLQLVSADTYQRITGSRPVKAFGPEMKAAMDQVAQTNDIHYCVLATIFTMESGGQVTAIGHDENVKRDISARRAFINSGCKMFSGKISSAVCSILGAAKNDDDVINESDAGLGLDWRFSHGIGVGQVTVFPSGPACNGAPHCIQIGNKQYDPKSLMKLETNLDAIATLWKTDKCPGTVTQECFRKYNGSGEYAEAYGAEAFGVYNKCLTEYQ